MHKKILILVLFFISNTVAATEFDIHGKLIPPDEKFLKMGLKQQKDGYPKLGIKYFKDAAKFGSNDAKYMIAMHHFSQKDWPNGYAWLNLMTAATTKQKQKIDQIKQLISVKERTAAASIYQQLKPKYSPLANLEHRQKWASKTQVGSRINGAPAIRSLSSYAAGRNAKGGVTANAATVTPGERLYDQVSNYVYEFENTIGQVVLGDLELIDE